MTVTRALFGLLVLLACLNVVLFGNNLELGRKRKLGDGCYHVFLDVGSNIGVHSRFLFEPSKYPDAKTGRRLFNEHFGGEESRDNRDICSFAFEPNPVHVTRHRELSEAYSKKGWRYVFIPAGVSDRDGNLTFYHQGGEKEEQSEEWGFGMTEYRRGKGTAVNIPVVRLAQWLKDEIKDRKMPSRVHGDGDMPPKVVMKMDVESAEYAVLPDLAYTGVACELVDFIFGEFHGVDVKYEDTGLELSHEVSRDKLRATVEFLNSVRECKTTLVEEDDEAYLHDGVPFPTKCHLGRCD
mmetsp:Transcript_639/g.1463  ORF Transcript_639/g.1463 Transcript_639/m.1463 type:complete len:295 (+) Transcript_639:161-1045(+)